MSGYSEYYESVQDEYIMDVFWEAQNPEPHLLLQEGGVSWTRKYSQLTPQEAGKPIGDFCNYLANEQGDYKKAYKLYKWWREHPLWKD